MDFGDGKGSEPSVVVRQNFCEHEDYNSYLFQLQWTCINSGWRDNGSSSQAKL